MIRTVDSEMRKVLEVAANVAQSRAAILITGESGTGKELLARYIHEQSPRAKFRFVALNCAAVPEGLLESELFGHEKGSFTSADQRKIGKFEHAHQGTLLLDEISEMPLVLQAKLLRVIQEGEIERVGGDAPIKVNVRLIATTNRDLREMIQAGQFREDLFYRLNVVPMKTPTLRSRPRDVDFLSRHFLEMCCAENQLLNKSFATEALQKLMSWKWPGNVRELKNTIERSALLAKGQVISMDEILIENFEAQLTPVTELRAGMTVSQAEKMLIIKTLEFTQQNRTKAAQLLGISIRTLRNKLHEYRLEGANESSNI